MRREGRHFDRGYSENSIQGIEMVVDFCGF
jgi:hypothetical protein